MSAAELLAFFRERGWSIAMDDRPGQALWPFEVLAAALSGVPEGAASEAIGQLAADGHVSLAMRLDAAVPSPEPLDVERLATALHAMPHHYRGGPDNDLARMACQQMSPSACEHKAASIAREYARLAAPQPVPEDET